MLKRSLLGLALTAAAAPAMAAPAAGPQGAVAAGGGDTVNSYTPAQERRARAAAQRAGYRPGQVVMAQAGVLFMTATRGAQTVQLTVTPEGQVYASTSNPPATPTAAAPGAAAPGAAAPGAAGRPRQP